MKSFFAAIRSITIGAAILIGVMYAIMQTGRYDYAIPRATVHALYDASLGDESGAGGSGVMIAPRLMLTAAHVAKGRVLFAGSLRAPTKLLRIDEKKDLALLLVALDCPCAMMTNLSPSVDDHLVAVGFPMNGAMRTQFLTSGSHQGTNEDHAYMTAQVAPGNSGGGVFVWNGLQWALAGITIAMVGQPYSPYAHHLFPHLAIYTSTISLREFINGRSPRELISLKPEVIK